jgi:hypothetical protein
MCKFRFIFLTFLLPLLWIFQACETTEGEPVYTGEEYFGFTTGKWLHYKVDSIVYDDFLGEIFTYSYEVKEINKEFFTDSQGINKIRIERFFRVNNMQDWQIKNVWTSYLQPIRAVKTEENINFVKLVFPVSERKTWNGNVFNSKDEQSYFISDIHQPYTLGNLSFDSTLTVLQNNFVTLIGEEFQYEMYAIKVGMIYKKYVDLEKEIDGTIIRGVDYSYTLIDYGDDFVINN